MRKCVTKRAPSSFSGRVTAIRWIVSRTAPSCLCMKFQIRNFFDGARSTRKEETSKDMGHERTEEDGRIKRRPRKTRGGEGEEGRDARYLRIQIKSLGRHVGEKKSGVVYRSSSYLTARSDSEIYLALSSSLVSRSYDRTLVTRSSHWTNGRILSKNVLYICRYVRNKIYRQYVRACINKIFLWKDKY